MLNDDEICVGSFGKRFPELEKKNGFKKDLPVPPTREVLLMLLLLISNHTVFLFQRRLVQFWLKKKKKNLTGAN